MSSPRDAISAISSAVGVFLDILGIALFFLAGRIPGRDEVVVFTLPVLPDLENHGTKAAAAPTNGTKLLRIIVLPIDEVYLVEYILRLFQADAVFSLGVPVLLSTIAEPYSR